MGFVNWGQHFPEDGFLEGQIFVPATNLGKLRLPPPKHPFLSKKELESSLTIPCVRIMSLLPPALEALVVIIIPDLQG